MLGDWHETGKHGPRAHAVARTNMHPTRNGLQVAHQPWIFTMCQVVVDMQCLLMRWPDYMLLNGLIYGVATSSAAPHNPSWPFHRAMVLHTICAIKMWVNCPYVILDDGHPGFHQPIWCGDFPIETSSRRWVSAWFPSVFSMIFHDGNPTVSVFQGPKGFHHNLWHSHWPFWGPSPTAPDLQHWRRRHRPSHGAVWFRRSRCSWCSDFYGDFYGVIYPMDPYKMGPPLDSVQLP